VDKKCRDHPTPRSAGIHYPDSWYSKETISSPEFAALPARPAREPVAGTALLAACEMALGLSVLAVARA
jgi:hypothetical protein